MRKLRPIILCGGVGARLKPVSSLERPKQFLRLKKGGQTMLQDTALRFKDDLPPIVVTAQQYADAVRAQMDDIGLKDAIILAEPLGRNTAPAIALALHYMQRNGLQDEDMLVLPCDHMFGDTHSFRAHVKAAQNAAADHIVLFGIKPKSPQTQYGYIEVADNDAGDRAVLDVAAFKEKPNKTLARKYMRSGHHFWNSGIFLMSVPVAMAAYNEYAPALWYQIECLDPTQIAANEYEPIVKKAFDRLILEYAPNIVMRRCDLAWADIGNWSEFIRFIFRFHLFT